MVAEAEVLKIEEEWTAAILLNDPEAIGRYVSNDWVIIGPEGMVISREQFLGVIRSGLLSHKSMDSEEVRIRVYGDSAVLTSVTRSVGSFAGESFATYERATSVYARIDEQWKCVLAQLTPITG